MSIASTIYSGVPPRGLGVFSRDRVLAQPFSWRAVNASRADAPQQVSQARALGDVWLYSGPESWSPANWRENLGRILNLTQETQAVGFICDAEGQWPELSQSRRRSELALLGAGLRSAASVVRVGFTSYPSFPDLDALTAAHGDAVWGAVQMLDRDAPETEATLGAWFRRWSELYGLRLIPVIAGYAAGDHQRSPEGFAAYLSKIPDAPGAAAWVLPGPLPAYIQTQLTAWSPGGSDIGTTMRSLVTLVARPAAIAVLVAILLIVVVVASFAAGVA